MQETWVQSLGQEDPLEKKMATHSSILAWRIPWREEPGGLYRPWGCKESHKMLLQCFRIVMLRKTSDGPLDCKKINQSILKEINPEYSLEGQMLKLQYFGDLTRRADSLEKTFMLGKIEGRKRRG